MAFLRKQKQKMIQSRFLLIVIVVIAAFISAFLGQIVITSLSDSPSLISDNSFIVQQAKDNLQELKKASDTIFSNEVQGMVELYDQTGTSLNKLGSGIVLTNDGWVLGIGKLASHIRLDSGELLAIEESIADPSSTMVFYRINSENLAPVTLAKEFRAEKLNSYLVLSYRGLIEQTQYLINDLVDEERISSDQINRYALFTRGEPGEVIYNVDSEVIAISVGKNERGLVEALDVAQIRYALDSVLRKSAIERPILGITYIDLSKTALAQSGTSVVTNGALIKSLVLDESVPILNSKNPAVLAGLRLNDIVVSVNSDIVNDHISLSEYILKMKPGDTVELGILRLNQPLTVEATLLSSNPSIAE